MHARRVTPVATSFTQTEGNEGWGWGAGPPGEGDDADGAGIISSGPSGVFDGAAGGVAGVAARAARGTVRNKKRGAKPLGGFEGLVAGDRPGRIRGLSWTLTAISGIYSDKTLAVGTATAAAPATAELCGLVRIAVGL